MLVQINVSKNRRGNSDHTDEKQVVNPCAREWSSVHDSYKTPAVLLIYRVMSGKSLDRDRGRTNIYVKSKRSIVI